MIYLRGVVWGIL